MLYSILGCPERWFQRKAIIIIIIGVVVIIIVIIFIISTRSGKCLGDIIKLKTWWMFQEENKSFLNFLQPSWRLDTQLPPNPTYCHCWNTFIALIFDCKAGNTADGDVFLMCFCRIVGAPLGNWSPSPRWVRSTWILTWIWCQLAFQRRSWYRTWTEWTARSPWWSSRSPSSARSRSAQQSSCSEPSEVHAFARVAL